MTKKTLLIGDLHFGEKGNSTRYNHQILDFIDWCVEQYAGKVDRVVQVGDYFHHRTKLQLDTLNYGIEGAKRLQKAFGRENVYVLAGNHDLFYNERLDVSSVEAIAPYVTLVNDILEVDDLVLTPWIINGEHWDRVVNLADSKKSLIGHFEFNGFKMNENYVMEHGQSHRALKNYAMVFSGHYHSFQKKDNVVYVGTPMPITMNEANEKHYVVLFDEADPASYERVEYGKVKVVSIPYDQLADRIPDLDPENTSIRVEFPDDLEDETLIAEVQDILKGLNFTEQKIKYKGKKAQQLIESDADEISDVENIDEAVMNFIKTSAPVPGIDKDLLLSLYLEAKMKSAGETNA